MRESIPTDQVAREAATRSKLPDECMSLIEAAASDPGAPFEPEALAMLRKLRAEYPAGWQRFRAALKGKGGAIGDLDRATALAAGEAEAEAVQGRAVEWPNVEPCAEPVDGAKLLTSLARLRQLSVKKAIGH